MAQDVFELVAPTADEDYLWMFDEANFKEEVRI
jgi:hypothetical protein